MSKKIKLDLKELKIQSFVTTLNDDKKNKLKGAGDDVGKGSFYQNSCGNGCTVNWC